VIVLIGFMGAGKTTVGHLLAGKLGLPFIDSDVVIEERGGRPVRQIFADDGEDAFRALEHETVAGLLRGRDAVLALGGGAVEHPATQELLRPVPVVYLHVGYPAAVARVGGDAGRPMLRRSDLEAVYQRRLTAYAAAATLTVRTDGRGPEDVCLDIVEYLAAGR
jgi:shikimate kinase